MAILDEGRVVFAGEPMQGVQELEGRVWERSIEKHEQAACRDKHDVLSTKLVAGRPLIRILSDEDPGDGFTTAAADLEDVYFSMIRSHAAAEETAASA